MRPTAAVVLALCALCALRAPAEAGDFTADLDWRGLLQPVSLQRSAPARFNPAQIYAGGAVLDLPALARRLDSAQVVYVGEKHDEAADHLAQRDVLLALLSRGRRVVVGLEMLDAAQQGELDGWLSGAVSDADFSAYWKKAWGFPFELYKPLLEACRDNHVPVRALNAPISVIGQIARGGLASLSPAQRAFLPARVRQTDDADYLAFIKESIVGHAGAGSAEEARMLEAMAAWNETMGKAVADAASSGATVLVAAGEGHMLYKAGIPESARRRAPLSQAVILPYPQDGQARPLADLLHALSGADGRLADYFWLNAL